MVLLYQDCTYADLRRAETGGSDRQRGVLLKCNHLVLKCNDLVLKCSDLVMAQVPIFQGILNSIILRWLSSKFN